ncbi:hypothetical protein [Bowdeniella massiliensis]|uniref:hypothetical protein n=1 Tax=Bowdeniella massiliensis TaxID=2932264 RepID=UPI0020285AF4|nr:hypothetical protein [Bowdeniella massiliensis]
MSINRFTQILAAVAVSISVSACTPVESGPTHSPTGPASPEVPTATGAPVSVGPTQSFEPRDVQPVPEEEYPEEVEGFTLVRFMGASAYDRGEDDRIGVRDHLQVKPVRQWLEYMPYEYEESLPGIWCFEADLHDTCMGNGTTGRVWAVMNQFDSLSREELAAWAEQFMAVIP